MTKPTVSIESLTFSDGTTINLAPNEKLLLVGPNNSGKSLTLREILRSSNTEDGEFETNKVLKGMSLAKVGTAANLQSFLNQKAEFRDSLYRYQNWNFYSKFVSLWDNRPYLIGLSEGFIKNIVAETRLQITGLQSSVSPDEQKTVPQHVLYDDQIQMQRVSELFKQAFGEDLFFDFRGGPSLPIHVGKEPLKINGEDRVDDSYVAKVRANPLLHEQGDGVKSYAGILFETVATERDITLIDEPEAFLHPPQMRRLGETLASEVSGQLVVSTHSSDIMRGFLTGTSGSVRIVRLQRDGEVNRVTEASVEAIKTLWEQPELRYSNALEGIFHEQTIICEDDSDCRLLNSIADHIERGVHRSFKDTAYVPAGGKHGIHKIASVLRQIGVPVTGVFDIDLLSDNTLLKKTVEGFGGKWSKIRPLWNRVNLAVTDGISPTTNDKIKKMIVDIINRAEPDSLPKGDICDLLKRGKAWGEVKKIGKAAIPNGDAQTDFDNLSDALKKLGIVIVPVGEVENYCPKIGLHGRKFVTKLLQTTPLNDPSLSELQNFVGIVHTLHDEV